MRTILFLALAALLAPSLSHGHASGLYIEAVQGAYVVDVGYSDPFVSGLPIRFDLALLDSEDRSEEPFSGAWVRVARGNDTIFAGPIGIPSFGVPGFTLQFPEAGEYELSVRYERDGESLARHDFPIAVASEGSLALAPWMLAAFGALLGALAASAVGYLIRKR